MKFFSSLFLLWMLSSFGQNQLTTKEGKIYFEASVTGFEEVKATTKKGHCKLNTLTGGFEGQVLIKSFQFKLDLMEEHFNNNYLESNRYPKSVFKGKISGFKLNEVTEQVKNYPFVGTLELHGKTQPISCTLAIKKQTNNLLISTHFYINADQFNIEIPSIITSKVSNRVLIDAEYVLK